MKTIIILISALGLYLNSYAQLPADKTNACIPLSSESFVVLDVLSQQLLTTKYGACVIVVNDSTYATLTGVKKNTIEEIVRVTYDKAGNPSRAEYSFDANTAAAPHHSAVYYESSGNSILSTYTAPSVVPITTQYLFQRSVDARYISEAYWMTVKGADTTRTPFYRLSVYRDHNHADSLIVSEVSGSVSFGRIASVTPVKDHFTYTYHWFAKGASIAHDTTWTNYSFLSNHSILMESSDLSTTKYMRDSSGHLIYYEHTWIDHQNKPKYIRARVTRSADGHPTEMHYSSDVNVTTYSFQWQ